MHPAMARWLLTRMPKSSQWERTVPLTKGAGTAGEPPVEAWGWNPTPHTIYKTTQNGSTSQCKNKSHKTLKRKPGDKSSWHWSQQWTQHPKHKHKGKKKKKDKLVFQFTVLCLKGHYRENEKVANKQETREKVWNHVCDKGLIFRTHEELLQLHNKQLHGETNGQRTRYFSKSVQVSNKYMRSWWTSLLWDTTSHLLGWLCFKQKKREKVSVGGVAG